MYVRYERERERERMIHANEMPQERGQETKVPTYRCLHLCTLNDKTRGLKKEEMIVSVLVLADHISQ